jgi:hypothetical protein
MSRYKAMLGRLAVMASRLRRDSGANVDRLVAAALSTDNPKHLMSINSEVTEANFGTPRPPRGLPTATCLPDLDLMGHNPHVEVVSVIDAVRSRPTMAEVLLYVVVPATRGGWDGEATVHFVLEDGTVGSLEKDGASRRLRLLEVHPPGQLDQEPLRAGPRKVSVVPWPAPLQRGTRPLALGSRLLRGGGSLLWADTYVRKNALYNGIKIPPALSRLY